jgi:choice-of-anchor B domain-containing protein
MRPLLAALVLLTLPAAAQDKAQTAPHHPTVTLAAAYERAAAQPIWGARAACQGGLAAGLYPCRDVDLMSFVPIADLGGGSAQLNDVWGWTDPETRREYALVGRVNGTTFVDVTDPERPAVLGQLPQTPGARPNVWRDVKTLGNFALVVADNAGAHGLQIFDLTRLRGLQPDAGRSFAADTVYRGFGSAHNIVVSEAGALGIAVGSSGTQPPGCGRGFHMVDLSDPLAPRLAGCYANTQTGLRGNGYVHDAQCVTYAGPDARFTGRPICIGFNETAVDIADVSNPDSVVGLGILRYPNVAYTHQGWLSEDHRYVFVDDELDEVRGGFARTRTLVLDLESLDSPALINEHLGETPAIDHNQYTRAGYTLQANYAAGLRILDTRDPLQLSEVAFFDTYPATDEAIVEVPGGGRQNVFEGAWSNYPFLPSGKVLVSGIGEGLFVVQPTALSDFVSSQPVPPSFDVRLRGSYPVEGDARVTLLLPAEADVTAELYDLLGRRVVTVPGGRFRAGEHPLLIPTASLAAGLYLLRVEAGGDVRTLRIVRAG